MVISKSVYDSPNIRCVPVIASFSSKGEIKPLYATINESQLKIDSYTVHIPSDGKNWVHFLCSVVDYGIRKEIILKYNITEHAWFVNAEYFR